eukprot:TRINITY_DN3270_c0_g1_i1.p1 TRINITY_DN3270_c0_g1~~TRINITY_DN3270_c0_g1_i1.p1  ORF type:complete len:140 (-),score=29.06 TRINITY_DN3270_c0_g1_i1:91-510(-)
MSTLGEGTGSGFILKGNHFYHNKDYKNALDCYLKAMDKETYQPARWNIHNRLCATYTRLKDYDSSLKEAENMIKENPNHPKGHIRKGGAHYFKEEYQAAMDEYNKATELTPKAMSEGIMTAKERTNLTNYINETKAHLK